MIGRLEHKLTVKATDDVYEETKKKAKLLEEERQGVRLGIVVTIQYTTYYIGHQLYCITMNSCYP